MEFVRRLLESDFMPHGHCYQWRPEILWLHVGADSLIALSYFTIPLALVYFVRRRTDIGFGWIFYLFAGFILFCGLSHAVEIYNVWHGAYRIEGVVKAATAGVSMATALVVWPLLPRLLAIPTRGELEAANAALVTEVERRRAAEAELVALNDRLEQTVRERTGELALRGRLLDLSHDAVLLWDADRQLRYWNRGTERLIGGDAETIRARLAEGGSVALLGPDLENVWSGGGAGAGADEWSGDLRVPCTDGRTAVVSTRFQHLREEASGEWVLAVGRDVTDRRRAERLLERANDELQQFAYAASHDLQSPLRRIAIFMELLKERYGEGLNEEANEFVDHALSSARRMQQLVRDLLEYSRSGEQAPPERVALAEVVEDVKASLGEEIERTSARVEGHALPVVHAPRDGVERVLLNLVGNALKYGDGPPHVEITGEAGAEFATVHVRDDGIGIAPEHHETIFGVFKRLHRDEEIPGSGVGLATVRRIVEGWGGQVRLDSAPGEGSTFSFTVPVTSEASEASEAAATLSED